MDQTGCSLEESPRREQFDDQSRSGTKMNDPNVGWFCRHDPALLIDMKDRPANDVGTTVVDSSSQAFRDDEIRRLNAKIIQLEAHVCELEQLAHVDPLVGLPNRRSIFKDLERVIARLNRHGGTAAIIFVDVDGLKQINDRFGHPVGDAALIKIAQTLLETVRRTDTVARLSGDEFIILLPTVDELGAWNMALRVAEATVASPLNTNSQQVALSVAVGVSTITAGDRPIDVISRADQAMYKIKTA